MLQLSQQFSLQNALIYTAVFEVMAEARWIARGGKVFWGTVGVYSRSYNSDDVVVEFVHEPTGAIAQVDVAQDRVVRV